MTPYDRLAVAAGRMLGRALAPVIGGAAAPRVRASYDAGSSATRLRTWQPSTLGPNDATIPTLRTMRDRSRERERNDPTAGAILDALATEIVGSGITMRSLAFDPRTGEPAKDFRKAVDALWLRSEDEWDADGQQSVYGQQYQAVEGWLTAGEAFVRTRLRLPTDGLAVPIQFQVLEPEFCPHDHDRPFGTGNRIRAGIELTPIGRRAAYWFYRQRPGDAQDVDRSQLFRVAGDEVAHVYLPRRPGQLRGVPWLTRVLLPLRQMQGTEDATNERQWIANMFVGTVEEPPALSDEAGNALDPVTGKPIARDAAGDAPINLRPGQLLTPPIPGTKIAWNEPPKVGQEYEAFLRQIGRRVAAGAGVPYYRITGDLRDLNDRTVRNILQDFRRFLGAIVWRVVVYKLCRPTRRAWMERAIVTGELPMPPRYREDPEPWLRTEYVPERWPYIHPLADSEAQIRQIRAMLLSHGMAIRENGYDPDVVYEEAKEERELFRGMGLVSSADAGATNAAGALQGNDPATGEEQGRA